MDDETDTREQIFHNVVREHIIFLLLIIMLYLLSYAIIRLYKRRAESDDYYSGDEDFIVYRIVLYISIFSLAVSLGALLLLPFSIISNEVLLRYPNSYYVQWLNSSLIHGLWNLVFLFSNLCLFILLPFAYFFTESEGFTGSKKGIMARIYETFVVLLLLAVVVLGIAFVASALFDQDRWTKQSLFNIWNYYLPWLYSCISLLGVLMLLICTPVGFARLFTVVGDLVVKPQFMTHIEEELHVACWEEENLRRKIAESSQQHQVLDRRKNGLGTEVETDLQVRLRQAIAARESIERRHKTSPWRRNLGYPLTMLLLLALTAIAVVMVTLHSIKLLVDDKALPGVTKHVNIGHASLSTFGPVGAAIEIALILYFILASIVGFYSLPLVKKLRPKKQDTSMTIVIGNCIVWLVLSSALPVLARTLGITNFDLLGDFSRIDWLTNFRIVLFYNLVFAVATAICLVTKFTGAVRRELYVRLGFEHISRLKHEDWASHFKKLPSLANGIPSLVNNKAKPD